MHALFDDSTSQLLQQVARFAERRHTLLTTNVAHATTPGYERHDLDVAGFRDALKEIVEAERSAGPRSVGTTGLPKPTADSISHDVFVPKPDTERHLRFHDAGVRSVESEMTELTKNKMLYDSVLQLLTSQFETLQAVISERP